MHALPKTRRTPQQAPTSNFDPMMRVARYLALLLAVLLMTARVEASDRERARQLFDEAVQSGKRGDHRTARSSLAAAWALVKSWDIAMNLGAAELKLGQYRDAAEHLAWGIREGSIKVGESDEAVIKARSLLAQAAIHVGTIKLAIDQTGASVMVDDQFVGRSPLPDPIYVDPGTHVIMARGSGTGAVPIDMRLDINAGQVQDRVVRLLPRTTEGSPGSTTIDSPSATRGASGLKPKTVIALAGGVLTAGSLAIAVVYTAKGSSAQSDADTLLAQAGPGGCERGSDLCSRLADAQARRIDANQVRDVAWIATGLLGASTAAVVLLWPKESTTSSAFTPRRWSVGVGPSSLTFRASF